MRRPSARRKIDQPESSRAQLSRMACRALEWRKPDGGLKEMSCRVAMLRMHREGLIQLPEPRNGNGPARPRRTSRSDPEFPVRRPAHQLPDLRLEPVLSRSDPALWNEYVDRCHYLGYRPLPGAQLRCFACSQHRLLALRGFGAAAWKTAPSDRFIGWSRRQRENNLQLVVNNARFLILPWVQSPNLASKLLAMAARRLPDDWLQRYAYRPALMETFVDSRFTGACYKAANWILVGHTKGRGKLDRHHGANLPTKSVWLYPLTRTSDLRSVPPDPKPRQFGRRLTGSLNIFNRTYASLSEQTVFRSFPEFVSRFHRLPGKVGGFSVHEMGKGLSPHVGLRGWAP